MGITRGSEVQEIFLPLELCKSVYTAIDKELIFLQRERERERERDPLILKETKNQRMKKNIVQEKSKSPLTFDETLN